LTACDGKRVSQQAETSLHTPLSVGSRKGVRKMQINTMLDQEFMGRLLTTAKKNLKNDDGLCPMLFVEFTNGERASYTLVLPRGSVEKQATFATIGASLSHEGRAVHEAVFLSEGWFVDVEKTGAALTVAPSQHPQRQEAIVIIGRDASGRRVSSVVQPFTRDGEHHPVWEELAMASYNTAPEKGLHPVGLLDYLFEANQAARGAQTVRSGRQAN
jgi:hypothetical protein